MIVDCHFHLLAREDVPGCVMSPRLQGSAAALVANMLLGTLDSFLLDVLFPDRPGEVIPRLSSAQIRRRMLKEIDGAKEVDGVVLLALDRIHGLDGKPCESHMVTSNEYVQSVIQEYSGPKRLFFGASVHPYREDALSRLAEVKADGAVLVKWIPSSQQFDPEHPKAMAFHEKLVELGLPLLCHAGWEGAVPVPDDDWRRFENPGYLEAALELGVKVIIAHCAAPYEKGQPNYVSKLSRMLRKAEKRGWNLYADISALLLGPWRAKALRYFLKNVDMDRLVYGSDFPIPTQDLSFGQLRRQADIGMQLKAWAERDLLDKDVLSKRAVGIPAGVFQNSAKVLGL